MLGWRLWPGSANNGATGFSVQNKPAAVNALVHELNKAQLDTLRAQVASVSHAVLVVHVRVPGGIRSNMVARDGISEDPGHLVPWFDLAKKKRFRVGLIAILFSDDDWGWGGYWQPADPAAALASYHSAIQPYLQAAQTAGVDFVILCDEWSALFSSPAAVPAFRTLLELARADYGGKIGINVNKLEEADLLPSIAALPDFIGVTAYVPLCDVNAPSYQEMYENLTGASWVESVRSLVSEKAIEWRRPEVRGYMGYLRHLAGVWNKPVVLTTGYKLTVGAAKDPSDQTETAVDDAIQASAWRAFLDAALDARNGVGSALYGMLVWRWPPVADAETTGFNVQNKPAAAVIAEGWSRARP